MLFAIMLFQYLQPSVEIRDKVLQKWAEVKQRSKGNNQQDEQNNQHDGENNQHKDTHTLVKIKNSETQYFALPSLNVRE